MDYNDFYVIDKKFCAEIFENIFEKETALFEGVDGDVEFSRDGYVLRLGWWYANEIHDPYGYQCPYTNDYWDAYRDLDLDKIVTHIDDSHLTCPFVFHESFKTDVRCTDEALTQFHYTRTNEDRTALIKRSIEAAELLGIEVLDRQTVIYCMQAMKMENPGILPWY